MKTLDKEIFHILGGTELEGVRFHYTAQNGAQFKTDQLFFAGIFHLICSDPSKTANN